jgi:hypothetical protein
MVDFGDGVNEVEPHTEQKAELRPFWTEPGIKPKSSTLIPTPWFTDQGIGFRLSRHRPPVSGTTFSGSPIPSGLAERIAWRI